MLFAPLTPNDKIDLTDLTHSVVEGNGVFDKLMKSVNAHLEQEFQKGRIKGTEYSTVYLSAMQGVLETSLQFVLQKNKANKEIELIDAQIIKLQKDAELAEEQVLIAKQELLIAQAKLANTAKEGVVLDEQAAKLVAETGLLNQRTISEVAQTDGTGIGATSILGKQRDVLTNQASGFLRDAEQKAADIMIKGFSVVATTNDLEVADASSYGVSTSNVSSIITKLRTGVNA